MSNTVINGSKNDNGGDKSYEELVAKEARRIKLMVLTGVSNKYEGPFVLPFGSDLPPLPKGYFWMTPPLAQAMLSNSIGNRKAKRGKVEAMKRDALAGLKADRGEHRQGAPSGQWSGYAGTPIRIDELGRSLNGHNRFLVVIELGVCIMLPGIDIVPTSQLNHRGWLPGEDIGTVRSKADSLKQDSHVVAAAELLFDLATNIRGQYTTEGEIEAVIEAFQPELDQIDLAFSKRKGVSTAAIQAAVVLAGTPDAFEQYRAFCSDCNERHGVRLTSKLTLLKNLLTGATVPKNEGDKEIFSAEAGKSLCGRKRQRADAETPDVVDVAAFNRDILEKATRGQRGNLKKMAVAYMAFKNSKRLTLQRSEADILNALQEMRGIVVRRLRTRLPSSVLAKPKDPVLRGPAISKTGGAKGVVEPPNETKGLKDMIDHHNESDAQ